MKRIYLAAVAAAAVLVPAAGHAAAYLPTYGSPNSGQFQALRLGLDLSRIGPEGRDRFTIDGDANVIGGAFTHWTGSATNGERYELRYEKAWRPFEGQRTRALIDAPLNVITNKGDAATVALLSGGLEMPVSDNWSITPRVAYAAAFAPASFGGDGEVATASIASRYRLPQVGRGDLVIGNMIGYSATTNGILTDKAPGYVATENLIFRNGVAYQFPIKSQMFGRQTSARVSYTNTVISGDPVYMKDYHEVANNLGVRNRESAAKSKADLLRFGLLYTWGQDLAGDAVRTGTVTVGYRF